MSMKNLAHEAMDELTDYMDSVDGSNIPAVRIRMAAMVCYINDLEKAHSISEPYIEIVSQGEIVIEELPLTPDC